MKNRRALWMMAAAVLMGLGAVLLASSWLLNQPNRKTTQIALAAADVSLGQRLAPDMVRMADWPAASAPQGAFTEPGKLIGRVLKSSVVRGEPLVEAKLAPVGTLGGLSALITEGRRAITVRVNDVVGVAGFALPGNYVDIIVHTERDHPAADGRQPHRNQNISKIVLERILVLAVAQEVERDETKPKVVNAVTLEVTPQQAEALDLARSVGTLSLVLRNQVDPGPAGTGGATKRTLLAEAEPPASAPAPARPVVVVRRAPAAASPPRDCVSVISGTRTTKECF